MDSNPNIHPTAAKGFGEAADYYERGRPDYPEASLKFLVKTLRINRRSRVLDLGAGTGKFTRRLLSSRARLVAVEPVEAMRKKFGTLFPNIELLNGTAEKIPAPDSIFNAVVVAQAFHWFASDSSLKEINRVLKPRGSLALLWNVRDESVDWVASLTKILNMKKSSVPSYDSFEWKKAFQGNKAFSPLNFKSFKHSQRGDMGTVMDLVRSRSYIASLPEEKQKRVLEKVLDLLEKHPQTQGQYEVDIPYRTDLYWCFKK